MRFGAQEMHIYTLPSVFLPLLLHKNALSRKKNGETLCSFKNKPYFCIAFEKKDTHYGAYSSVG